MSTSEKLLEKWCVWLFKQQAGSDAAGDIQGGVFVAQHNQDQNPWLIPGTWGQVNVPKRKITVGHGNLFVVAASSHATYKELQLAGEQENDQNLKTHAKEIDKAWLGKTLATGPIDGDLQQVQLDTVTTDVFNVDIHNSSPYRTLTDITGGPTKMLTIGHVKLLNLPTGSKTRIVIAGQSPEKKIKNRTEKQYNVHVEYEVTVP
jgi:hypothetical protein